MGDSTLCYDGSFIYHYSLADSADPYPENATIYFEPLSFSLTSSVPNFTGSLEKTLDCLACCNVKRPLHLQEVTSFIGPSEPSCNTSAALYNRSFASTASDDTSLSSESSEPRFLTDSKNLMTPLLGVQQGINYFSKVWNIDDVPTAAGEGNHAVVPHDTGEGPKTESEDFSSRARALSSDNKSDPFSESLPDNITPNAICRFGEHNGNVCYVEIPSPRNKSKVCKVLALWILDRLSSTGSQRAELNWIRRVEEDKDAEKTVKIDLDSHADVLRIQFHDNQVKDKFRMHAATTSTAVDLADRFTILDNPSIDYMSQKNNTIRFCNDKDHTIAEVPMPSDVEAVDVCDIMDSLKKNPIQRLPSMSPEWKTHTNDLVDYLQRMTPEGYYLANDSVFAVVPLGSSKTNQSHVVGVRMLIVEGAGVALEVQKKYIDKVPSKIRNMRSYNSAFHFIDLCAILRCVPIDNQTFMVTLRNDETSRIVLTQFSSVLHRWAIGDILDSISCYGAMCNYQCSITSYEVKLVNLLQRWLITVDDTPPNKDLIHLVVDPDAQQERSPLSVGVKNHTLAWTAQETCTMLLDPLVVSIESFTGETASKVSINVENVPEPVVFHFSKPKLQCFFREYITAQMRRKAFFSFSQLRQDLKDSMMNSAALLDNLLQVCREHCFILARLNLRVQLENQETLYPSHFNLLCIRIAPDRGVKAPFETIDLRFIVAHEYLYDLRDRIHLEYPSTEGRKETQTYILQFSSLFELFSFQRLANYICSYYKREFVSTNRQFKGERITKAGSHIVLFSTRTRLFP